MMKSLDYFLFEKAYADVCVNANVTPTGRDLATARSRHEHEGDSFFTITLADFGKHFIASLEAGIWRPSPSFARKRGNALPAFLQGLLRLVFDMSSGRLVSQPSIEAIGGIWRLSQMFPKVEMECTDERRQAAEHKFVKCETDLNTFRPTLWTDRRLFQSVCGVLYSDVLANLESKLRSDKLLPKHGRGGTAEGVKGDPKYLHSTWPLRLERMFSYAGWMCHNYDAFLSQTWEKLKFQLKREELPAKVVFVPKTLKTPRVIAAEPIHMQYTQQAISSELVRDLENDRMLRKALHFTDQTVNATLALESSYSREYSTLDLSEASDRVHAALVSDLCANQPYLRKAIFACRSQRARLPSGKVIPLKKFASMGSALCFPMEAMVFLGLTIVAHLKHDNKHPTNEHIHRYLSGIHVYGDDIIIKKEYLGETVRVLETARLVVNRSKTFSNGHFRESCGTDAYYGEEITPVRIRSLYPTDRSDKDAIASLVSTANQFYMAGMWRTCDYLRSKIEDIVGKMPYVSPDSSVLGWHSLLGYRTVHRYNSSLHRFEVKGNCLRSKRRETMLEGYQLLMKYFLNSKKEAVFEDLIASQRGRNVLLKGFSYLDNLSQERLPIHQYTVKYDSVMKRTWAPIY
jgi:hypothetical protein